MPGKRKRVGERVCKDFESEDQKVAAAFARLVELGSSTCGAACLVGDAVYVSNNHVHEKSRKSNKIIAIQALMAFLGVKKNDDDLDAEECLNIKKDGNGPDDREGEKKDTSESGDDHSIDATYSQDEVDQDLEEFPDPQEQRDSGEFPDPLDDESESENDEGEKDRNQSHGKPSDEVEQEEDVVSAFLKKNPRISDSEIYKHEHPVTKKKFSARKDLKRVMNFLDKKQNFKYEIVRNGVNGVHAEMRLADKFISHILQEGEIEIEKNNSDSAPYFFGVSKLCCPRCDFVLSKLKVIKYRGRHNLLFEWKVVAPFIDSKLKLDIFCKTHSLSEKQKNMLRSLRKDYSTFFNQVRNTKSENFNALDRENMCESPASSDFSSQRSEQEVNDIFQYLGEKELTEEQIDSLFSIAIAQALKQNNREFFQKCVNTVVEAFEGLDGEKANSQIEEEHTRSFDENPNDHDMQSPARTRIELSGESESFGSSSENEMNLEPGPPKPSENLPGSSLHSNTAGKGTSTITSSDGRRKRKEITDGDIGNTEKNKISKQT